MVENDSNQEAYTKDNKRKNNGLGDDAQEKRVAHSSGGGLTQMRSHWDFQEERWQKVLLYVIPAEQQRGQVMAPETVEGNEPEHCQA